MGTIPKTINIILCDDHEIFRDGFRLMIAKIPSIKIAAEVASDRQLAATVRQHKPDIIIKSISTPFEKSIDVTKNLIKLFPNIRIIAMSMCEDENAVAEILSSGVKGHLQKNASKQEIIAAIKGVCANEAYYCKSTTQRFARLIKNGRSRSHDRQTQPEFSDREISIMQLICVELNNREIADKLGLSKRTIEGYREKILEKIKAKNTAGIVVYAIQNNIYKTKTA